MPSHFPKLPYLSIQQHTLSSLIFLANHSCTIGVYLCRLNPLGCLANYQFETSTYLIEFNIHSEFIINLLFDKPPIQFSSSRSLLTLSSSIVDSRLSIGGGLLDLSIVIFDDQPKTDPCRGFGLFLRHFT